MAVKGHPLFPKKVVTLSTHYLGELIDLKRLQGGLKSYVYLNRDHPIAIELAHGSYALVTKFGAISFWNASQKLMDDFIKEVEPFVLNSTDSKQFTDSLVVHIGAPKEDMTFEEIYLKSIDLEKMKIISYVSAQSVALDRYEHDADSQLKQLDHVVEKLRHPNSISFDQKSVLRHVGNILSIKQKAVGNLALLDKPSDAWEREEIEKLYDRLRGAYELYDRFSILNEKIDFLSENNVTLLNFVTSQRANKLEIIVIILIIFEILLFVFSIFKKIPGM